MDIPQLVRDMTLEEKAGLCSGADYWHTKAVARLGIPQMMVSDGPHGLRKQREKADHLGVNDSIEAVCFPPGVTIASSFDRELIQEVGSALGESARAENIGVLLGPGVNIKRSPLCGRNFEYFSEDPYLAAEMAASQIQGIQGQGVGACVKHFLANNQEHRRMSVDSRVDERTLREIYLPAFEHAVKEAAPWSVMCSYNRINGIYASEHHRFLTELLRSEWGFDGFIISDWGAVNDRVEGIRAGLDLEMPSSAGQNDQKIVDAVRSGELDEALLDAAAERVLRAVERFYDAGPNTAVFDKDSQHRLARKAAGESLVLLKNEGILPLKKTGSVAFIGEFAVNPRFQGGGSSHINAYRVSSAVEAASCFQELELRYAKGYESDADHLNDQLIEEATAAAENSDAAVIFAGLYDSYECEGYDRDHMRLPESHVRLIEAVGRVQPNTVVVLHNGAPVEMPWIDKVRGVLEAYLGGQAVGEAVTDILFGDVNPSGKLAETFPLRLEDNPSYLTFPGEKDISEYREGVFVGYRYYEKKGMNVLFPFGHGLSYTHFAYSTITLSRHTVSEKETLEVSVAITNSGKQGGKEIVQLYAAPPEGDVIRPLKELKGFQKISLEPGETKSVSFTLQARSFAYYNVEIEDWFVESGTYEILVGSSSQDIRLREKVIIESSQPLPFPVSMNTLMGDLTEKPEIRKQITDTLGQHEDAAEESPADEAITAEMRKAMYRYMPLRHFVSFGEGRVTFSDLEKLIEKVNRQFL